MIWQARDGWRVTLQRDGREYIYGAYSRPEDAQAVELRLRAVFAHEATRRPAVPPLLAAIAAAP